VGTHLYAKKGSRLASNATEEVVALWMDEDEGCYPDVGPEPTAIVRSSEDRRHLYWRLTRPVPAMWAQEMNRRLATWAGADVGAANLARVLRAPGTKNYKRHPEVHLVAFAETPVGCWEPEVLDQAIPPAPVQSVPSAPVQSG
jgi:hypothetical protein